MAILISFGAGVLVGLVLGTILTCLIQINRRRDDD